MADDSTRDAGQLFRRYIEGRVSRAQLFKATAAGLALATVPGAAAAAGTSESAPSTSFPYFPAVQGAYTPEQVQDILNVAVTIEHLAVTVLTAALTTFANQLKLDKLGTALVQSTVRRDQAHLEYLESLGAKPITTTFTIPPFIFADQVTFFSGGEAIETLETAGYMTAAREFAELGQPTLTKNAYQIGAVEAEGRALLRASLYMLGVPSADPPGNKAFETDLLLYARDELAIVGAFGFIGGPFPAVPYPGRDGALAAAGPEADHIIQLTPNNASSTFTFTGPPSVTAERP